MDPEAGKGLGGGAIEEMGPDIEDRKEPAKSPLYLPPALAAEREAQAKAQAGQSLRITIPCNALMTHLDEPDWAEQTLAIVKQKLVEQGANDATLVQITLADIETLNLPDHIVEMAKTGKPPGGVRANWAPGFKRKKRRKAAKPAGR